MKALATYTVFFQGKLSLVGLFLMMFFLVSCASTTTKESAGASQKKTLQQLSSKEHLPVRQYDKEGNVVPFAPAPNPYLLIKSKISKENIAGFIAARKAYSSVDYTKAEGLLNRIVKKDARLSGPWVMLGDIARKKNDRSLAKQHYTKAISVNKLNVNAYLPLALLQRLDGEFIQAQNTYAQALSVWRDFPEAHLNLAILYDLYLNDSLQAQQHMEAYQFLTDKEDQKVDKWLAEIRSRTGIAANLYIGGLEPNITEPLPKEDASTEQE